MVAKMWAAKQDWHPDDTRPPLWGGLAAPNACQMWQVFDAINCISSTRWRVNTPVLDVLETLWKEKDMKKLGKETKKLVKLLKPYQSPANRCTILCGSAASLKMVTLSADSSQIVNDIQNLECMNRQTSSNCERYVVLFGIVSLVQPRTEPPKLLRVIAISK